MLTPFLPVIPGFPFLALASAPTEEAVSIAADARPKTTGTTYFYTTHPPFRLPGYSVAAPHRDGLGRPREFGCLEVGNKETREGGKEGA